MKMLLLFLPVIAGFNLCADESGVVASWYEKGSITANGERFNPSALTCAHKTLPFGTKLRVNHLNKSITVRVNDRGPFIAGRDIDLSRAAFQRLAPLSTGLIKVSITHLQ